MRTIIHTTNSESREGNGKPANRTPSTAELPPTVSKYPIVDSRPQSAAVGSRIQRDDGAKRPH
jgi:hypothetical protein